MRNRAIPKPCLLTTLATMAFMQRRLPPVQDVFLNVDAKSASQSTLRRCRSFSGYAPFELSEVNFEFGLKPRVDPVSRASDAVLGDQHGPETWLMSRQPLSLNKLKLP